MSPENLANYAVSWAQAGLATSARFSFALIGLPTTPESTGSVFTSPRMLVSGIRLRALSSPGSPWWIAETSIRGRMKTGLLLRASHALFASGVESSSTIQLNQEIKMSESRPPDTGGEPSDRAPDAGANDWLDPGASTGKVPPMNGKVEREKQLNVWLASDLRVEANNATDPPVSPLLLVILGPDFESATPNQQKAETLPAESTRSRIADENPRASSSQNQRRRPRGTTLRRVREKGQEKGADRSSRAR
jgi:hypothetical protein